MTLYRYMLFVAVQLISCTAALNQTVISSQFSSPPQLSLFEYIDPQSCGQTYKSIEVSTIAYSFTVNQNLDSIFYSNLDVWDLGIALYDVQTETEITLCPDLAIAAEYLELLSPDTLLYVSNQIGKISISTCKQDTIISDIELEAKGIRWFSKLVKFQDAYYGICNLGLVRMPLDFSTHEVLISKEVMSNNFVVPLTFVDGCGYERLFFQGIQATMYEFDITNNSLHLICDDFTFNIADSYYHYGPDFIPCSLEIDLDADDSTTSGVDYIDNQCSALSSTIIGNEVALYNENAFDSIVVQIATFAEVVDFLPPTIPLADYRISANQIVLYNTDSTSHTDFEEVIKSIEVQAADGLLTEPIEISFVGYFDGLSGPTAYANISYFAPTINTEQIAVCRGDSIMIADVMYSDDATIIDTLRSQHACDSMYLRYNLQFFDPIDYIDPEMEVCRDEEIVLSTPQEATNFLIESNVAETTLSPERDTTLSYTYLDENGCPVEGDIEILIDPSGWISESSLSIAYAEGQNVIPDYLAESEIVSYQWQPSQGLSCDDCPTPSLTAAVQSQYVLEIGTAYGCIYEKVIDVDIPTPKFYYPNVVSRRARLAENSKFKIASSTSFSGTLTIYDRWGNQMYIDEAFTQGSCIDIALTEWSSGVYVFVFQMDAETVTGEFALMD